MHALNKMWPLRAATVEFFIYDCMLSGSRFAILQAVVVLANVVRNYKISTGYKSVQDVPLEVGIFIRLPRGTKTTLQRRIYRN